MLCSVILSVAKDLTATGHNPNTWQMAMRSFTSFRTTEESDGRYQP